VAICATFRSYVSLASSDERFFFFNLPAPTEIYTLSLHDALPISLAKPRSVRGCRRPRICISDCSYGRDLVCSAAFPRAAGTLESLVFATHRSFGSHLSGNRRDAGDRGEHHRPFSLQARLGGASGLVRRRLPGDGPA